MIQRREKEMTTLIMWLNTDPKKRRPDRVLVEARTPHYSRREGRIQLQVPWVDLWSIEMKFL